MTLHERYLNGETTTVYNEIYQLKQDAFKHLYFADIENVLDETFKRTAYNLEIIYAELVNIGYLFKRDIKYNFERPLVKPLPDTDKLFAQLETTISPFGFIPLSLKKFYAIVGACNFGWDYETNGDLFWQCADPIQITSLDDLLMDIANEDNLNQLKEYYKEDGFVSLELAADYLHKDNISGGPAYAIQLTPEPSIDGLFLHEEHNTTFIDYLRICFDNCGFSKITDPEYNNNYQSFFDKVKPQLKSI